MAFQRYAVDFPRLSQEDLDKWREIPATVVSDSLNRCQSMDSRIKAVSQGLRICGQARTVAPMPGDNSMVLHACSVAEPGDVIVVAGGGLDDVALAGEWVVRSSIRRRLGGLIVDGSIRDVREIRALGYPVFAKGAVPRGPHKNFGGRMDMTAAVGNTPVNPGDIVIGDDDGVVVVPLAIAAETLAAAQKLLNMEAFYARELDGGRTLADVLNLPALEVIHLERPALRAVA